jgi:DNA modification methylase
MSEKKEIKISAAKGRPMLSWVGKRPLRHVTAFPAQHMETFAPVEKTSEVPENSEVWKGWPASYPKSGLLFHGDNKEVLAHLLANGFRGKVKLIYIDPPFDSGADYVRKVQLRGGAATVKIEGESYNLGEQIQYTDIWANDNYLQFMYERLQLLKELLDESGVIFLHCNHEKVHLLRCIMDEIFGSENFRNDIIWKRGPGKSHPQYFGRVKDTILFYCKSENYTWNKQFTEISEEYKNTFSKKDSNGFYVTQPLHSGKPAKHVPEWRGIKPPGGRGWAYKIETLDNFEKDGLIEWSSEGVPRLKRYLHDVKGAVIQDVWADILECSTPEILQEFINFLEEKVIPQEVDIWDDVSPVLDRAIEHSGYPTQKPVELIERMINACSRPGDIILDSFAGSGPTLIAAQKLGRRWIGCDINKGAIQTSAKRLQSVIAEQVSAPPQLPGIESEDISPGPTQCAFTVWRVNDYDLKIQRNEAIHLACEHIGVERIASESYFDGKLGKKLVKIIPFEHPLSPLDLEELKRELDARLEVENTIVFVCLGIELSARTWIEDWNRHRVRKLDDHKEKVEVNKIEVVELRTDAKYGNFIKHEPASAKVSIAREGDKIKVLIEDFISPTILKRLDIDLPLFKAKITDWRSQVDCVMIDTDYNGEVFNVTLSNVPEKKNDLIDGIYTLSASADTTTVAVKIIDMLGEEVLITGKV